MAPQESLTAHRAPEGPERPVDLVAKVAQARPAGPAALRAQVRWVEKVAQAQPAVLVARAARAEPERLVDLVARVRPVEPAGLRAQVEPVVPEQPEAQAGLERLVDLVVLAQLVVQVVPVVLAQLVVPVVQAQRVVQVVMVASLAPVNLRIAVQSPMRPRAPMGTLPSRSVREMTPVYAFGAFKSVHHRWRCHVEASLGLSVRTISIVITRSTRRAVTETSKAFVGTDPTPVVTQVSETRSVGVTG